MQRLETEIRFESFRSLIQFHFWKGLNTYISATIKYVSTYHDEKEKKFCMRMRALIQNL